MLHGPSISLCHYLPFIEIYTYQWDFPFRMNFESLGMQTFLQAFNATYIIILLLFVTHQSDEHDKKEQKTL